MAEIKKRVFDYEKKESYTSMEVEGLLNQHNKFISGATNKELEDLRGQVGSLTEANTAYATADKKRTIRKIAKEVSSDNFEKLIKYTNLEADASEDDIKKAMAETAKDFVAAPVVDTKVPKVETKGEVKSPNQTPAKTYRFMNG